MALEIVSEIVSEVKNILDSLLPDYKRLNYEFEVSSNNERGITKRFGFIPEAATFKEGSALGFTTMEHEFQLILVTDYQNKDDDTSQSIAVQGLYSQAHEVLKNLQSKPLTLPTSGYRVLLISGISFDAPEYINENSTVVLRANLNFTYRFRNNF